MRNNRGFTLPGFLVIVAVVWAIVMTAAVGILWFQTKPKVAQVEVSVARIDANGQELTAWAADVRQNWLRRFDKIVPCTAPGVPPGCHPGDPVNPPPPPPNWD